MNSCSEVKDFFALYLYGELSFDEEERVESHLDACVDCRKALERQREVQMALDNIAIEPAPSTRPAWPKPPANVLTTPAGEIL